MADGFWSGLVARVQGWFSREATPGRFESGSKLSLRGIVTTAPFVWPARDYLVYVPKGHSRWRRAPLLVLCHGCKQTADDIAKSARIAEVADREGFVVLLPQQKDSANPWRCWNWFERRTTAGNGEAAIVAAQIRAVRRAYRIDRKRVVVAGLSAGGALAAILGIRYPDLVRGVAVHSGLACGAARSPLTALQVMQDGPDRDVVALARDARGATAPRDIRVPLVAIHGSADGIVAPRNAVALVRQYLALNGREPAPMHAGAGTPGKSGDASPLHLRNGDETSPAKNAAGPPPRHSPASGETSEARFGGDSTPTPDDAGLPPPDTERRIEVAPGRAMTVREWRREGRLVARLVEVDGLGHAWSGGDPAVRFTDATPPAASDLVAGLFADGLSSRH